MLRFTLAPLLLLAAASTAAACSIGPDDFRAAAWTGEHTIATTLAHQAVLLDLSDGTTLHVADGFFHRLAAEPSRGILAHASLTGIDSMCEGPGHLDLLLAGTGERIHRYDGDHRPLAASPAGVVAGLDGMHRIRVLDWDAPEAARTVRVAGLPQEPYSHAYGHAAALRADGLVLALAAPDPAELRLIDLETGGPWHGLAPLILSDAPLAGTPAVAFAPDGTRLAVHFTTDGRDRLAILDTAEDPPVLRELHHTPAPVDAWYPPMAAWVGGGVATVHGGTARFIPLEGDHAVEVVLKEDEKAANVVADPDGARWALLTATDEHADRVLMFTGDAHPVAAWQREGTAWSLHPLPPDTVQPADASAGDGSWTMAPGTPERGVPGPAFGIALAAVLVAAGRVARGAAGRAPADAGVPETA